MSISSLVFQVPFEANKVVSSANKNEVVGLKESGNVVRRRKWTVVNKRTGEIVETFVIILY